MPKVVQVNERITIKHLKNRGWSFRRIARELKLDRRTVKKHWKLGTSKEDAENLDVNADNNS